MRSRLDVHRRRLIELLVDSALIVAALVGAFLLRVDGSGTVNQRHLLTVAIPVVLAARLAAFIPFGLYRGVWRYAGASDAARVVLAVAVSELAAFALPRRHADVRRLPARHLPDRRAALHDPRSGSRASASGRSPAPSRRCGGAATGAGR